MFRSSRRMELLGLGLLLVWSSFGSAFVPVSRTVKQNARLTLASLATRATKTVLFGAPANSTSADDEELIRLIRGPLGAKTPRPKPKTIIILSDQTGVTAKSAVGKSLEQFNGCDQRFINLREEDETESSLQSVDERDDDEDCINVGTRVYPFLKTDSQIASVLKAAHDKDVIVVFTLADPELRDATIRMCELSQVEYVDLLGPMFSSMTSFFGRAPLGKVTQVPSSPYTKAGKIIKRRKLSDDYYRRIDAVEFTLKCDDGMKPRLLKEADVILLGVSRTGKTPLSVVLAQTMGLKVANIPLVVDLPPPVQLFSDDIDPQRVFLLTLDEQDLMRIRRYRLNRELKHASTVGASSSSYADPDYLQADLAHARDLARKQGYTVIDVTGRAVEETASLIQSYLNDRFPELTQQDG